MGQITFAFREMLLQDTQEELAALHDLRQKYQTEIKEEVEHWKEHAKKLRSAKSVTALVNLSVSEADDAWDMLERLARVIDRLENPEA